MPLTPPTHLIVNIDDTEQPSNTPFTSKLDENLNLILGHNEDNWFLKIGPDGFEVIGLNPFVPNITPALQSSISDYMRLNNTQMRGTSGIVFTATHLPSSRTVALKTIHDVNVPGKLKSIITELSTLMSYPHDNTTQLLNVFYEENIITIVLEHMDQLDIKYQLKKKGQAFPELVIACIAIQLLRALDCLHRMGVIHRDIKPANLLLNSQGYAKLGDFGVSRSSSPDDAAFSTYTGTCVYMSPERITCQFYNKNSDIWAFGITLLEMALGTFPYYDRRATPSHSGTSTSSPSDCTIWNLRNWIALDPAPILPDDGGFTDEFRDFLRQALQKDHLQRPTAHNLLQHPWILHHILGKDDAAQRAVVANYLVPIPEAPGSPISQGTPLPQRKRKVYSVPQQCFTFAAEEITKRIRVA